MSVHSNHYEDPEEYERDLKWEYRREDNGQYYHEDIEEPAPTCGDCAHCRRGQGYSHEIVDIFGRSKEDGGKIREYGAYIRVIRKPKGYIYLCDKNPDNLLQTDHWKDACEEFEEVENEENSITE